MLSPLQFCDSSAHDAGAIHQAEIQSTASTSYPHLSTITIMMAAEELKSVTRPTFHSEASRASVTTEHLALIGFAARLGTCVNNDTENGKAAKSVRDEAMLLMSLLTGKKASEILSEEVGVNESPDDSRKKHVRPKDRDMGNFSFTFPSLSLQPDAAVATQSPTHAAARGDTVDSTEERDQETTDLPPPSKLLSRTQSITDKDDIRASSEHMAHNVLDSFGAALQWRAKTWIKSLAHVLALKEEQRLQEAAAANGKGGQGGTDRRDFAPSTPKNQDDMDLMSSREIQIIDAIVKSSEDVVVVNLKTSFRVTPNRIQPQEGGGSDDTSPDNDSQQPERKKFKTDQVVAQKEKEYKVAHKLIFEAIVTMTSNDGGRYKTVKLQAPGVIEGVFVTKSESSEKEETLTGVSLELDTDALALSLERQSRLVVRKAAEATLVAASGIESGATSPTRYTDSPHVHHSVISPRYVLMSPIPTQPYISDYEDDLQKLDLSFPVLTDPKVDEEPLTQESRVESSTTAPVISDDNGCGSDSSAATTTTFPSSSSLVKMVEPTAHTPFPALLSVAKAELTRGE